MTQSTIGSVEVRTIDEIVEPDTMFYKEGEMGLVAIRRSANSRSMVGVKK